MNFETIEGKSGIGVNISDININIDDIRGYRYQYHDIQKGNININIDINLVDLVQYQYRDIRKTR